MAIGTTIGEQTLGLFVWNIYDVLHFSQITKERSLLEMNLRFGLYYG